MLKLWCFLLGVCGVVKSVSGFSLTPMPHRSKHASVGKFFEIQASPEDEDLARVPRRRQRGRFYDNKEEDDAFYDSVERNVYGDDELYDEDLDDDDDNDDDEEYGLFSNVLIDNPILDNIDPDGAAERFPELARDPRFWIDMALFIALLNWLSSVGPQDYFPDIPYYV